MILGSFFPNLEDFLPCHFCFLARFFSFFAVLFHHHAGLLRQFNTASLCLRTSSFLFMVARVEFMRVLLTLRETLRPSCLIILERLREPRGQFDILCSILFDAV